MYDPYKEALLYCIDQAAAKYFSGNMSFDEAVNFAEKNMEDLINTEEFKKEVNKYFDNFVDIKSLSNEKRGE